MKFKSQVLTQASGSVGGITYAHNQGGLYQRARSIPVNPQTPEQVAVRDAMSQISTAWVETLTPAQRAAWRTYAQNVPLIDSLGDPINVGPIAMYNRSNISRLQASLARVDDAPTIFDLGEFTGPTVTASAATGDLTVTFTEADDWVIEDGASLLVYSSRQQNAAVSFFKGPYRFAGQVAGDSGTPPTSPATIASPFAIAEGNRIWVKFRVTRADGRLSAELVRRVTVAA